MAKGSLIGAIRGGLSSDKLGRGDTRSYLKEGGKT